MPQNQLIYSESLGKFIAVAPGETPEQAVARANGQSAGPSISPDKGLAGLTPPHREFTPDETQGAMKDASVSGLKALTAASGFIPGAGPAGMALRTALPALFGGAAAAVEGKDVPTEMLEQATAGAAGEIGGKYIPRAANRVGLAMGGLYRGTGKLAGRASKALTEVNEKRGLFNPVLLGQVDKVKDLKDTAGKVIEAAENTTPGDVPLKDLFSANKDLYNEGAKKVFKGVELRDLIKTETRDVIEQLAQTQNNIDPKVWARLTPKQKITVIENTTLDARTLGELKRNAAGREGKLQKSLREGAFVPTAEQSKQQVENNFARRAGEMQSTLDQGTATSSKTGLVPAKGAPKGLPNKPGRIAEANANFGRFATIEEAQNSMRSLGLLADPSILGSRAGLGMGLGTLFGMDPRMAAALGTLTLTPSVLSAGGHVAGKAAKYAPSAYRIGDAIDSASEEARAKRRKPK